MPRWIESLICPPMLLPLPAPWPAAAPAPSVDMLFWVAPRPDRLPLGCRERARLEPLLMPPISLSLSSPVKALLISLLGLALAVLG